MLCPEAVIAGDMCESLYGCDRRCHPFLLDKALCLGTENRSSGRKAEVGIVTEPERDGEYGVVEHRRVVRGSGIGIGQRKGHVMLEQQ